MSIGRRIQIQGTVQGVGFRPWVYRLAHDEGISGSVKNGVDGVTIEAFGLPDALNHFVDRIRHEPPPAAHISRLSWTDVDAHAPNDFAIVPSDSVGARRASVPPDLATCLQCMREVMDPDNRRYRYAFTNCTHCGPRFTIITGVPYDRPATTMAPFVMCDACLREYRDVRNRRFHAQPNACPECGPALTLRGSDGTRLSMADPITRVAALLLSGQIAAVKGVGGYHLACDATSDEAVLRLRARKHRDEKPFAVMVPNLGYAVRIAELSSQEVELLTSVERPIVLVNAKDSSILASSVAPDTPRIGLMLPYTPLHQLLLDAADHPLVMTSGNISETPISCNVDEAHERLGDIADVFLDNDRVIANPADDSVAIVISGQPILLRRSRGYVPRPIEVAEPFERPILACGGQLNNTFCVGVGDVAYVGPHIGDLDNIETYDAYTAAIDRMLRFLDLRPDVIACDLHPDFLSTRYALDRPHARLIGVQHHHAHVMSAAADRGLTGPVFGFAYDGTGLGTDGTAWGGELLLVDGATFKRISTVRPLMLPGGDEAIRQVWRIALSLGDDAFGSEIPTERFGLFRDVPDATIRAVRQMRTREVNCPMSHGFGRYFDAVGALCLNRPTASYEGQVAMLCELAADLAVVGNYPFDLDLITSPWQVDLRPTVRAVLEDLASGRSRGSIAARFHDTVVRASVEVVFAAARAHGAHPIVLTGGCFQNARLTARLIDAIEPELDVYVHRQVPPGDGGLALGQAVVANHVLHSGEDPSCV